MNEFDNSTILRASVVGGTVILILILFAGFLAVRYGSPEPASVTFLENVEETNTRAKKWLFNNVRDKGLFVYTFNPETGELPNTNNAIRQLMASRILAAESVEQEELRELHQRNLDFLMEFWYREDGESAYIFYNDKSKLGANAMMLRVLVASPFYEEYSAQAHALARGILALQSVNGSFVPWYVEPSYAYNADYLLTFYSGEALLALVEYYEKTGDSEWLAAAEKSADFYIDHYVTNLEQNYYPAYVPWHTLAYNKLYLLTGDERYAEAVFVLNDKLLEILDTREFVGRFYNPETPQYGSPHASSDAVYTEGLAYALEVARRVSDAPRQKRYQEALELAVGNLAALQYRERLSDNFFHPDTYIGALRIRENSPWIRVDTTQHTIDALTKLESLFN